LGINKNLLKKIDLGKKINYNYKIQKKTKATIISMPYLEQLVSMAR
jgi:hypothetical protein